MQLIALGCPTIKQHQANKWTIMIKNNIIRAVHYLPSFPKQQKRVCYLLFSPVGKSWCGRWRTKEELPTVAVI